MRNYVVAIDDYINKGLQVTVFGEGKPEVLITAGIHGGEVTGIYTSRLLMEYLEKHQLHQGSVKIISICNPTAFRRMERTSPYDNLDLNRIFPGNEKGTLTQRIANAIWQESLSADFIIDLHCCGVHGYSYTLAVWQEHESARQLASMLDIPLIVQSGGAKGQLFVESCAAGRPAVIIELPGGGQGGVINEKAGLEAYNALIGLLGQLEMLKCEVVKPSPTWCDKLIPQRAGFEGLFIPKTSSGQTVVKDQVLGIINGIELKSPCKGTLTSMRPMGYVFVGSPIGNLAPHID